MLNLSCLHLSPISLVQGPSSNSLQIVVPRPRRQDGHIRSEEQIHILQLNSLGLGDEQPCKDDCENSACTEEEEGSIGNTKQSVMVVKDAENALTQ